MTPLVEIIRLKEKPLAVKGVDIDGNPYEFELKHLAGRVNVARGTRLCIDGVGLVVVSVQDADAVYQAKREMQGVGA